MNSINVSAFSKENTEEKNILIDIESAVAHTSDPRLFWGNITRSGPTTKNKVPKKEVKYMQNLKS